MFCFGLVLSVEEELKCLKYPADASSFGFFCEFDELIGRPDFCQEVILNNY
jgi:hypothetical protein